MIGGLISGLTYIHDHNIIHRDLHPNNIFLDADLNPKIGDFGMSVNTEINQENETLSSDLGVKLYKPPEKIYTTKSDVYSMGLIFFEILYPFGTDMERHKVLSAIKNGLYPKEMSFPIIRDMTNLNPDHRPAIKEVERNLRFFST